MAPLLPFLIGELCSGLSFIDGGLSPIRWRFPVAFQLIPLFVLLASVWFFPESPRWLVKQGRVQEASYILKRLRGDTGTDLVRAETELREIQAVAELELSDAIPTSYMSMLLGTKNNDLHIGRRVQLVIWLQIFQEWVGIAGVTICKSGSNRLGAILCSQLWPCTDASALRPDRHRCTNDLPIGWI